MWLDVNKEERGVASLLYSFKEFKNKECDRNEYT